MSSTWRCIAQRILTGEFLDWNVPLNDASTVRELSGPGGIYGTIDPPLLQVLADDGRPLIEEWSTALYIEEDNEIRAAGIVKVATADKPTRNIEAPGFSVYPTGIPIADDYVPTDFEDPMVTFRKLWNLVQTQYPDSNLGVKVVGGTSYFLLTNGSGPYKVSRLEWRDFGDELNNIAQAAPFDFVESHTWVDSRHAAINHTITQGFPRLGARRDDLVFEDSMNIVDHGTVGPDGERYANDVFVLGAGEGRAMPVGRDSQRDGRLRRCAVVAVKDGSQGQVDRRARAELRARGLLPDISDITVVDHPNARLSSITPGDDIFIQLDVEWYGYIQDWYRVVAINSSPDNTSLAVLKVQRADAFAYAALTSGTGLPVLLTL